MPSARYFREQAQLLLNWALATNDPDYATWLSTRAMEHLAQANQASDGVPDHLHQAITEFNNEQLRGRPKLQQQQIQSGNKR